MLRCLCRAAGAAAAAAPARAPLQPLRAPSARALATAPASTSSSSSSSASQKGEGGLTDLYMRAVEPPPRKVPPPTPEEAAAWGALSRRYVQLMWRRERVRARDLHRKVQLKWAALHALPSEALRREALGVTGHVPMELCLPQHTPPSTGFHGPEEAAKERARQEVAARERARAEDERLRQGLLVGEVSSTGRRAKAAASAALGKPKVGGAFGSTAGGRKQRFGSSEEDE
jgi:hypothetical protein